MTKTTWTKPSPQDVRSIVSHHRGWLSGICFPDESCGFSIDECRRPWKSRTNILSSEDECKGRESKFTNYVEYSHSLLSKCLHGGVGNRRHTTWRLRNIHWVKKTDFSCQNLRDGSAELPCHSCETPNSSCELKVVQASLYSFIYMCLLLPFLTYTTRLILHENFSKPLSW